MATVVRGLADADSRVGGVVMIARARRDWPTTLSLWIDIEDGSGNKLGPGPIRDFTGWRSTSRLDRAGGFAFEMPAANERASLVEEKRVARCYGVRNGAVYEVGAGIIDFVTTRVDADGRTVLRVQGDDLLRELTYRSVAFLAIDDGSGGPGSTALDDVMDAAPAGWALDDVNGYDQTKGLVYARFAGESVLTALKRSPTTWASTSGWGWGARWCGCRMTARRAACGPCRRSARARRASARSWRCSPGWSGSTTATA